MLSLQEANGAPMGAAPSTNGGGMGPGLGFGSGFAAAAAHLPLALHGGALVGLAGAGFGGGGGMVVPLGPAAYGGGYAGGGGGGYGGGGFHDVAAGGPGGAGGGPSYEELLALEDVKVTTPQVGSRVWGMACEKGCKAMESRPWGAGRYESGRSATDPGDHVDMNVGGQHVCFMLLRPSPGGSGT